MYYTPTMQSAVFEAEKNRKAFLYTVIICAVILLLAFFIAWPVTQIPPPPPIVDVMEIDLGAAFGPIEDEFGGGSSAGAASAPTKNNNAEEDAAQQDAEDDNAEDAAPVMKNTRPSTSKVTPTKQVVNPTPKQVVNNTPKPPTPKAVMGSSTNKNSGGQTDDFGNGPGRGTGTGPGTGPGTGGGGGGNGGPKIAKVTYNSYSFTDDVKPGIVYATINVSSSGRGTFIKLAKGSSVTENLQDYINAVKRHLPNIEFDKTDYDKTVIVKFNFKQK